MMSDQKEYKYKYYCLIDSFKDIDNPDDWLPCPVCGLRPKVWIFNNGCEAGCGCHNSTYDHRAIWAESIMSVWKRTGNTAEYSSDNLRKNWNHWVETGEIIFDRQNIKDRW